MIYNLLSASSVLRTIGSVALAILILLAMITVHEFGHYLAGKLFHFTIDEFSIGFGPALFKRRSKKTGELFAVRLIPLGGYCAFAGEDGIEEEEQKKEKKKEKSGEKSEEPFPETAPAEKEEPVGDGAAPSENAEKGPRPVGFTDRPCWQRIIVLVAGAFMNYLLALLLIIIGFVAYGQTMLAVYEVEPPAEEYASLSLHDKDILLKVEGKNLYLTSDIAHALNGKKEGEEVHFLVARETEGEWEPMLVTVRLRSDVSVRSSADFSSVWEALGVAREVGEDGTEGAYSLRSASYTFPFWEALGRGFVYSFKIAGSIFQILGELLTGKLGLSAFGGPLTTIKMTSEIVSQGFRYFLEIAGYIGVNLAVLNLLPVPALDGSKVIFTAIEWVRGKPISRKVEAIIHAVGFVLLLGFAVLVDVLQFVL